MSNYLILDTETVNLEPDSSMLMFQWGVFDTSTLQLNEVGLWSIEDMSGCIDTWEFLHGPLMPKFSAYVFFNAKFDVGVLKRNGINVSLSKVIDTSLIDYCIDTRRKSRGMNEILLSLGLEPKDEWNHANNARFLSSESWKTEDWKTFKAYALRDISTTASLLARQLPSLQSSEPLRKMVRLEHDYLQVIVGMESTKLHLDSAKLEKVSYEIESAECESMESMLKVVRNTPGKEKKYARQWDMVSGARLAQGAEHRPGTVGGVRIANSSEFIFDHCELSAFTGTPAQFLYVWSQRFGKEIPTTGWENKPTTKAEALLPLAGDYDRASCFVTDFLDWKRLSKLRTSFLSKWEGLSSIGYNLNQRGTSTGRLSCSDFNVQQIPRRGEKGDTIRDLFVAPPGFWFAAIDLSAIDARCLAHGLMHFFGDDCFVRAIETANLPENIREKERLSILHGPNSKELKAFEKSIDFHTLNSVMWGMTRDEAKTALYAIMFGVGAEKLGKGDAVEGQRILDLINDKTPNIQRLKQMFWDEVAETGELHSHFGRTYFFPEYRELVATARRSKSAKFKNRGTIGRLERQIFSCYIQGSAADVFKIVTIRTAPLVEALGGVLAVPVHDELIIYFPNSVPTEDGLKALNDGMNATDLLTLPVRAEAGRGNSWREVHN
jgi:DNA polymerase I-like protein with 3'-5' exonuclease and polymerase domains